MAAMDFPASPTIGQTANGYTWDSEKWKSSGTSSIADWTFATNTPGVDPTGATDSTAGIVSAIAATPVGGTLVFPAGDYLITGAGAQIFSITKAINILGMGSTPGAGDGTNFAVAASVPATRDIFRIGNPSQMIRGITFRNFNVTSAGGGAVGQHCFHFDTSSGSTTHLAEVIIENVLATGETSAGGYSVFFDNGTGANTNGGTFNATVRNCYIGGGIFLSKAGDTLRIQDNIITGPNMGISGSQVSGAGQIIITGNNITSGGGMIVLQECIAPVIAFNQIEGITATTEPNNALVDILGPCPNPRIIENQIQNLTGTGVPLRIDNVNGAYIDGNRLSSSVNNIVITAAATNTSIGMGNLFLGAAARVSDSGSGTVDPLGAWKAYVPTTTVTSGTVTATGRYKRVGKTVYVNITLRNNTAITGTPTVSLPVTAISDMVISGKEIAVDGAGMAGFATAGTSALNVLTAAGLQMLAINALVILTGSYEAT